jgi:SMI1 / KNR4 family.
MSKKLWKSTDWRVIEENFKVIEKTIGYSFPKEFKNFILENQTNGLDFEYVKTFKEKYGYSPRSLFKENKKISELRSFNNFHDVESYIDIYYYGYTKYPDNYFEENDLEEEDTYNFPKEIVIFANDGGWNFAFDFRGGRKAGKIPVVWLVDNIKESEDECRRIKYFTDSFEDFLECLGNPEKDVVDEYIKG